MKIPLFKIYWDEEDIKAVTAVITSGEYWCVGPEIEEFENMIKNYLNAKYCLTFNSGGSALFALMLAYGFKPGDEVIVPSFSFIATAYAPLYVGAKPVFADIEEETFGLDPEDVERKITSKTKAIMPIHYGGMPCRIQELKKLAEDYNLILIEDAAESFGAKFKEQFIGTFGDSAIFSFCHNKVFTTSEGGCVVTHNRKVYERLKLIRSYGRVLSGNYFENPTQLDYIEVGYNLRMSTILAALGVSQLKRVNKTIEIRRRNAEYLNKELRKIKAIKIPEATSSDYYAVYQMYTIRILQGKELRDKMIKFLQGKGITTRLYFNPLHKYSVFKKLGYGNLSLPKTEEISSQVLTLPMYPHMTKEEINYIINSVQEFFQEVSS